MDLFSYFQQTKPRNVLNQYTLPVITEIICEYLFVPWMNLQADLSTTKQSEFIKEVLQHDSIIMKFGFGHYDVGLFTLRCRENPIFKTVIMIDFNEQVIRFQYHEKIKRNMKFILIFENTKSPTVYYQLPGKLPQLITDKLWCMNIIKLRKPSPNEFINFKYIFKCDYSCLYLSKFFKAQ